MFFYFVIVKLIYGNDDATVALCTASDYPRQVSSLSCRWFILFMILNVFIIHFLINVYLRVNDLWNIESKTVSNLKWETWSAHKFNKSGKYNGNEFIETCCITLIDHVNLIKTVSFIIIRIMIHDTLATLINDEI